MEKWLEDKLDKVSVFHKKCKNEGALQEYLISLKQLLNSIAQMDYSYFHTYEKEMLWEPVKVFSEQFLEQVKCALEEDNNLRKESIITDIENSLSEIFEVYKNIVDGTANSDRLIFTSKTVNTSLYEVSPKICTFYSTILNRLVKIFDDGKAEYAFIMYPAICRNITAIQLFRFREKSGKVVIVHVPERKIEEFDILPVHLVHETFHIITKYERKRNLRSKCYYTQMVYCIKQLLFSGVQFLDEENGKLDDEEENRIAESIFSDLFDGVKEEFDSIYQYTTDDRAFYSTNLKTKVLDILRESLVKADNRLVKSVELHYCAQKAKSFTGYQNYRMNAIKIADTIHANLFEIFSKDRLKTLSDTLLRIYTEAYADILCVLTIDIGPEFYFSTFEKSVSFQLSGEYFDMETEIRKYVVADAVCRCRDITYYKKWKEYRELSKNRLTIGSNNNFAGQENERCDKIMFTKYTLDVYCVYMRSCAETFYERISKMPEIDAFRSFIRNVMEAPQEAMLKNVLADNF